MTVAVESLECPGMSAAQCRLLLVQQAGASFDSPFDLRSPAYARWLESERVSRTQFEAARAALLVALERAIPAESDRPTRHTLLQGKRAVYNRRAVPMPSIPIAADIQSSWMTYAALLQQHEQIFREGREGIVAECRARMGVLLQDERFRLAYRYASPDLAEDLDHHGDALDVLALSRLGLGLAAYAAKFLTKANPFHLFAEILIPRAARRGAPYEVVLDLSTMMRIEARLVAMNPRAPGVWACLSPHVRRGHTYEFTISTSRGLRSASVPVDSPAGDIIQFFDQRTRENAFPACHRSEWQRYCAAVEPAERRTGLQSAMVRLCAAGVVHEYAIVDWKRCASALRRLSRAHDPSLGVLQRHHLRFTTRRGLRNAHASVTAAAVALSETHKTPYFVNAYSTHDAAPHESAARELDDDLRLLKPLFTVEHNFAGHAYVMTSFATECATGRGGRIGYLELVRQYVRSRGANVARLHPATHQSADHRAHVNRWRTGLAALSGVLTRDQVQLLSAHAPAPPGERQVCFKGPFDYVNREYYISNVYAGHGRFAGRYDLQGASYQGEPESAGCVDVELAVPFATNLNYVARAYPTGTGFEPRYAHAFRRWIDPSDIVVDCSAQHLSYRHAPTGQQLRIHYRGFLLATSLPPEYQFLLAGHADVFLSPFVDHHRPLPSAALVHRPRLSYGAVCLRRERWDVSQSLLEDLARERDALRFGATLRAWMHERLKPEVEDWFYEPMDSEGQVGRPRYLDLCNPFSVLAFRRCAKSIGPGGGVSFTVMEPGRTHLFRHDGERYATELLIEV